MEDSERDKMLASAYELRERELAPISWEDPFSDMNTDEKSKLLMDFMNQIRLMNERLEKMESERASSLDYKSKFEEEHKLNLSLQTRMDKLLETIESLRDQLALMNQHTYGSKTQKRKTNRSKTASVDHTKNKDDFDGTPGSIAMNSSSTSATSTTSVDAPGEHPMANSENESRFYRQGMEYRTMKADKTVRHRSDLNRLPAGAKVIKVLHRYSYEQISSIVEHDYELVRYKALDGSIIDGYFPCDGEAGIIDVVPGTHASGSFLAYLAFNKYVLDTPLYRELVRMMDERMQVSRMTLTNWLEKGSMYINGLIKILKENCLEKDSIVNCDETWCRVKVEDSYKKKYIWCLVNKAAKVVIYCYEDGSRGRDALRHILGESQLKALQSDGYNVYMYLDDKLIDTEHLCCLAHARVKFKYASEQGGDKDADFFLDAFGELYRLEAEYEKGKLSAGQIKACRENLKTKEIIIKIRSKLDAMLSDVHPPRGDLMEKALNYLNTFWTQLFAYIKDGSYTIDNSIAERFIRPLSGERKNSLFFGSGKMAGVSAAYHTIISTCKMQGVSALQYLKMFFQEIVNGRRDYENLLPMTIGLGNNKL